MPELSCTVALAMVKSALASVFLANGGDALALIDGLAMVVPDVFSATVAAEPVFTVDR